MTYKTEDTKKLKKIIYNRIKDWCENGNWLDEKDTRPFQVLIKKFYDVCEHEMNIPIPHGWECALVQFLDITDETIYSVLPYLLTSYIYNYEIDKQKISPSLPKKREVTKRSYIIDFLAKLDEEKIKSYDGFLGISEDGIANELRNKINEDQDNSDNYSLLNKTCESIAKKFIFPKMKEVDTFPNIYTPREGNYAFFMDYVKVFLLWYYLIYYRGNYFDKLDPVLCFKLFYKNFCNFAPSPVWPYQKEWINLYKKVTKDVNTNTIDKSEIEKWIITQFGKRFHFDSVHKENTKITEIDSWVDLFDFLYDRDDLFTGFDDWDDLFEIFNKVLPTIISKKTIQSSTELQKYFHERVYCRQQLYDEIKSNRSDYIKMLDRIKQDHPNWIESIADGINLLNLIAIAIKFNKLPYSEEIEDDIKVLSKTQKSFLRHLTKGGDDRENKLIQDFFHAIEDEKIKWKNHKEELLSSLEKSTNMDMILNIIGKLIISQYIYDRFDYHDVFTPEFYEDDD